MASIAEAAESTCVTKAGGFTRHQGGPTPFRRRPIKALTVSAAVILTAIALLSVIASVFPVFGNPREIVGLRLSPPSWLAPLGTDSLGRSLLPRLFEGTGVTLVISVCAVLIAATASTVIGMIAGYFGGWFRETVLRVADILYAFPSIILAILIAAVLGPGQIAVISAIVLVTMPLMIRMVCAATMSVSHRDYVTSAYVSGLSTRGILVGHVLTGISGTIAVQGTYALSVGILVEGGLSFLGQGVQIPKSSIGLLVQEGATYMIAAPWLLFAPAIALILSILSITVIGDALRDRFEPRKVRGLQ